MNIAYVWGPFKSIGKDWIWVMTASALAALLTTGGVVHYPALPVWASWLIVIISLSWAFVRSWNREHTKAEKTNSLERELAANKISHLEDLSNDGHFWARYCNPTLPIWTEGMSRWCGCTTNALNLYYGKVKVSEFETFDGVDRQHTEGIELRYLNRRLQNLRRIIQSLEG